MRREAPGFVMGYYLKTWIGVLMMVGSIAAFAYALYSFIGIGTCASGTTPYVIARPCPASAGLSGLLLTVGIIGLVLGFFVLQLRGDPPEGRANAAPPLVPLGWALWGLFFLCGGIAAVAAVLQDPSSPGMLGALIIGIIFIPMGLGPLVWGIFSRRKSARAAYLMQHGTKAAGVISDVSDTGVTINNNPYVRITVKVQPQTGTPFDIVKTSVVSRVAIPRPGQPVIVWYDPNDHSKCVLGVPPGMEAQAADNAQSQTAAPADSLDRLERLVKLRDEGALTNEEFETQKARLLGET